MRSTTNETPSPVRHTRRRTRAVVVAACFVLGVGGLGRPADVNADHASGWFRAPTLYYKWPFDPGIVIGKMPITDLGSSTELPSTIARVQNAAATWSGVSGSNWDPWYAYQSNGIIYTGSICAAAQLNSITLVEDATLAIANTTPCMVSGLMESYLIRYGTDPAWYNGTGSVPSGERDFWSNVTHELGHAGGFKPAHFVAGTAACPGSNNTNQSTMCEYSSLYTHWRTLTSHDTSVFAFEY